MTVERSSFGVFNFLVTSKPGKINIDVFNCRGAKITTIAEQNVACGILRFSWNAKAGNGKVLRAGMYVFSLRINGVQAASFGKPVLVICR